jgi:1A family penicillin-binding protein
MTSERPMWRDRIRHRQSIRNSKRLVALAKLAFFGVIIGFVFLFFILPVLAFNLPSPDKIVRQDGFSTKILDRNGSTLYDIYQDKRRTPVELDTIPLYLRQGTIAIEDKNFYGHQGFDPFGMLRGLSRILTRGYAQGGSTLTQQLVKNVLLTSDYSVVRKIKEFVLAVQIERKYSKDEILQMYLNEAPYGGTAYGVESASEIYFGKGVSDLNLVESAILAGMPQRPSAYSPYSSTPKAYVKRTEEVLRRMREDDYINKDQEKEAVSQLESVEFKPRGSDFKAPHFVQYVQKILEERYGEAAVENGGLKVTTTLDLELQEKAQEIVAEEIAKVESQHITNGAAVVVNPETGEILSMVGSKDFNADDYDGQVNVTTSLRQPGSSFKPFTYVTAFKEGYSPSTLLMDVATTFPGGVGQPDYKPVNYDGKFKGPVQVRFALGNSLNIPAVKMLALVGIKDVLKTANDMGITTLEPNNETLKKVGLSLTLGGGEVRLLDMGIAYSGFVNKGYKVDPVAILKVEDINGKVLEEVKPEKKKRVISEEQAFLIADILSDNNARKDTFGTNSLLNISGRKVMVKTGTTNDRRDNWTVGGDGNAMVGVWVGNNDNSEMLNVASGVTGASPIWRRITLEALKGKETKGFDVPDGIVRANVDVISGYRSHDGYPARDEYFIKGSEAGEDTVHVKLKVCKNDGNLATPGDISSGNYDEKEYFVFKEEDPTGSPNRWQEGILSWLGGQADTRYHPPRDYCGSSNPVVVEFVSPGDKSQLGSSFTIKVKAESTSDIVRVELYIDGSNVRNFDSPPFNYDASGLSDGIHTIRAMARDANGKESDRTITIGVNVDPNASPAP